MKDASGTITHDEMKALVGMGAMVAGTTHAPLTAIFLAYEITRSYSVMLPLMLAAVLAVAIARALRRDSVYTAKLKRRGIDLDAPAPSWAHDRTVGSAAVAVSRRGPPSPPSTASGATPPPPPSTVPIVEPSDELAALSLLTR